MSFFNTFQLYFRSKPTVINIIRRELDIRQKNEKSINGLIFQFNALNHIYPLSSIQKRKFSDELQIVLDNLVQNKFSDESIKKANVKFDEVANRLSIMARCYEYDLKSIDLLTKICEKKHHLGVPYRDEEKKIIEMKNRLSNLTKVSEQEVGVAKRFVADCEKRYENCNELSSLLSMLKLIADFVNVLQQRHEIEKLPHQELNIVFPYLVSVNYSNSEISKEHLDEVREIFKNMSDTYKKLWKFDFNSCWRALSVYFNQLAKTLDKIKNNVKKHD